QQVEVFLIEHLIFAHRLFFRLQTDNGAGDRAIDFNAFTPSLEENLGKRGIAGQVDGKTFQGLLDRVAIVVMDGADLAAPQVLQDKTFEEVVNVVAGELKIDAGVAFDGAFALEIADAAAEEDDPVQRQAGGGRFRLTSGGQAGRQKRAEETGEK